MPNFVLSDPLEILSGISGNVLASVGSGYALLDEAASAINPTVIPNRLILTTGLGAVDNEGTHNFYVVVESTSVADFSTARSEFNNTVRAGFGSASWALLNETASTTNPTLIPNRGNLTSGIGGTGAEVHIIAGGTSVLRAVSSVLICEVGFSVNNAIFINGTQDENQLRIRGDGGQTADLVRFEINDQTIQLTVGIDGQVSGGLSGAYALLNEASTETNPTLIPNRDNLTTGIGGLGGNITIVLGGQNRFEADGNGISFFGGTPAVQAAAYTRTATIVESRTLAANASASIANNNSVLAAIIADLQAYGLLQ